MQSFVSTLSKVMVLYSLKDFLCYFPLTEVVANIYKQQLYHVKNIKLFLFFYKTINIGSSKAGLSNYYTAIVQDFYTNLEDK